MISEAGLKEALANCNREPINTPGSTQTFGALVAADTKLSQIELVSSNTDDILGVTARELPGQPISMLLDDELLHRARNILSHRTISEQREIVGESSFAQDSVQISMHVRDNRAILEFLPMHELDIGEPGALERTRALLTNSASLSDFRTVLEMSVDNLRISTEFDRVKAYRFLPDGSGEVVAESRAAHVDSFLGLRFPASDIPLIARQLYAKTPIRVISDVEGSDVPIIGICSDARPLDLSLAILRGTADVHTRYLQNMGVKSSMTLPIVVDEKLWGLFSMHHMKPRIPDPTMLIASELSGKMLSLIIQHTTQTRHQGHLNNCTVIASEFFEAENSIVSDGGYWRLHRNRLVEAIPCHGVAYVAGDEVSCVGSTPTSDVCQSVRALAVNGERELVCFDDLSLRLPACNFDDIAGALIMSLTPDSSVILFRKLAVRNISWAGKPEKKIVKGKSGLELSPRNSFSQYSQSIEGRSEDWTNDDMEVAAVLQISMKQALNAKNEKKDNQARLQLMVQELNHRVRNILTLVQSLSSSSKSSATSLEGYAIALEQRIVALAGAHDLLTREDMLGVRLQQIAALELQPYLNSETHTAYLDGPVVILKPDVSPIIALVFHELTSNAVKYGALSKSGGRVALTWSVTAKGLEIEWAESNGPRVVKPTHEGFGRSIIEDAIPYEFGGSAQIEFRSAGIRARFSLPNCEFETADDTVYPNANDRTVTLPPSASQKALHRGLIVEDNYVIANEAKRWFAELGFQEIIAVATVHHALSRLDEVLFDFCLLDVNLRGTMSEPIAHKLAELGTPYVFASGYGSEGSELCDQFDVPFLTKPVNLQDLRNVLEKLGVGK